MVIQAAILHYTAYKVRTRFPAFGRVVRASGMARHSCFANRQRLLSSANESFLFGRRDRFG
jgi:hypothetical protein